MIKKRTPINVGSSTVVVNESYQLPKLGRFLLDFGDGVVYHNKMKLMRLTDIWEEHLNRDASKRPYAFLRSKKGQSYITQINENLRARARKHAESLPLDERPTEAEINEITCVHKIVSKNTSPLNGEVNRYVNLRSGQNPQNNAVEKRPSTNTFYYGSVELCLTYVSWGNAVTAFGIINQAYEEGLKSINATQSSIACLESYQTKTIQSLKRLRAVIYRCSKVWEWQQMGLWYALCFSHLIFHLFGVKPKEIKRDLETEIRKIIGIDNHIALNNAQKLLTQALERQLVIRRGLTANDFINKLIPSACKKAKSRCSEMDIDIQVSTHQHHRLKV